MSHIYYPGLNCHLAALVNLADRLGLPYEQAYSGLWSEEDFTHEPAHGIYTSRRVFAHLAALGLRSEPLPCGPHAAPDHPPRGTLLLVGMDAFHTPWHPVEGHFHSAHYFPARMSAPGTALCDDPVYGVADAPLSATALMADAYELHRVYRVPADPPPVSLGAEAEAVLYGHPALHAALLARLEACACGNCPSLDSLIQYTAALLGNRHLFARYLHGLPPVEAGDEAPFSTPFLARWEGVRCGLYKAGIVRDKAPVLEAVAALLTELLEAEQAMARRLLARG